MQNQILGFFIITTIAFAGLSAVQWKRSVHYREQAVAMRQEAFEEAHRAGMQEAEARSLERRLKQRDEDTAALTEMVQALMASTNELTHALALAQPLDRGGPFSGSGQVGNQSTPFGMLGKMFEDPSMQEMVRAQQKMMMDTMYGPLFQDLNLTEEETKSFKELLLDSQMASVKFGTAAMSGDEKQRQAATESLTREQEANEAAIKACLGEQGFEVYQDYQKTMGDRVLLNQFKTQLDGSQNSLREEQFDLLLEASLEERLHGPSSILDESNHPHQAMELLKSREMQDTHLARQEEANRRVLQRAQDFLTPEQLFSLEEFQANQLKMMRLGLEMGRRMAEESGLQVSPLNSANHFQTAR